MSAVLDDTEARIIAIGAFVVLIGLLLFWNNLK